MQLSTFALAGLVSLVAAQSTRVQVVQVGAGGQTFNPSNIRANVGEMVQFQFMGGNHTATQSIFDQPCQPASLFNSSIVGFHSGFVPAAASAAMGQIGTYTIMINSTAPIWIYCAQGRHCQGGMTMVINEPANNPNRTLSMYRQLASQAQTVVPGGGAIGGQAAGQPGQPGQPPAGAGGSMLSVPSTLGLLTFISSLFLL